MEEWQVRFHEGMELKNTTIVPTETIRDHENHEDHLLRPCQG